jgi:hypothetical protein
VLKWRRRFWSVTISCPTLCSAIKRHFIGQNCQSSQPAHVAHTKPSKMVQHAGDSPNVTCSITCLQTRSMDLLSLQNMPLQARHTLTWCNYSWCHSNKTVVTHSSSKKYSIPTQLNFWNEWVYHYKNISQGISLLRPQHSMFCGQIYLLMIRKSQN